MPSADEQGICDERTGCSRPDIGGVGSLDDDGCDIGRADDDDGDVAQRGLGASGERLNGCSRVGSGGGVNAIQTSRSGSYCRLRRRGHTEHGVVGEAWLPKSYCFGPFW